MLNKLSSTLAKNLDEFQNVPASPTTAPATPDPVPDPEPTPDP